MQQDNNGSSDKWVLWSTVFFLFLYGIGVIKNLYSGNFLFAAFFGLIFLTNLIFIGKRWRKK